MAGNDRALVKNSADPKQVDAAERRERQRAEQDDADLRELLKTLPGRRFLWRVLGYCKVNQDIWDPSSRIHFNAGQQNVGHWLLAEVVKVDEESLFTMMRESGARARKEQDVAEAQRTAKITEATDASES